MPINLHIDIKLARQRYFNSVSDLKVSSKNSGLRIPVQSHHIAFLVN